MNAFILYFFLIVVINCHVIYAYANYAPEKVFSYSWRKTFDASGLKNRARCFHATVDGIHFVPSCMIYLVSKNA